MGLINATDIYTDAIYFSLALFLRSTTDLQEFGTRRIQLNLVNARLNIQVYGLSLQAQFAPPRSGDHAVVKMNNTASRAVFVYNSSRMLRLTDSARLPPPKATGHRRS